MKNVSMVLARDDVLSWASAELGSGLILDPNKIAELIFTQLFPDQSNYDVGIKEVMHKKTGSVVQVYPQTSRASGEEVFKIHVSSNSPISGVVDSFLERSRLQGKLNSVAERDEEALREKEHASLAEQKRIVAIFAVFAAAVVALLFGALALS
ncbi:MAG: hypothetical protein HRT82_12720 [Henriciella sp.]|nr:hypothetical protein [Henriciella sp.]